MAGRIKSIVKPAITGEQVYRLQTDFKFINDLTEEAFEKSRVLARYFLIDKILHKHSNMDYIESLINFVMDLENVLYTDKPVGILTTLHANPAHAS